MTSIRVSVQAQPRGIDSWTSLARRLESSRFEALLVGDHPGSGPAPWPALGAAAAVTSTLKLGTYVLQCGVRDPVQVASDAATLDILAPSRILLGLGAGHTFREWEVTGRERPPALDRAGRLAEFVDAVARLLEGETVTARGHPLVLRAGAARAAVVALSGLGRTRPDGHRHEVRWSPADLLAQLEVIHRESRRCGTAPEIEALVQVVTITDDRQRTLAELSEQLHGVPPTDLDHTPFVLVGTAEQIASQLIRQAKQSGIHRYVVREPAVDAMVTVIPLVTDR